MPTKRLAALTAVVALASAALLYSSHPAQSSDHQDSPAVLARPGADITDVFVFPSPTNAKNVVLAMDVVPLIPAGMSSNYSLDPDVLYQFKIAHGPLGSKYEPDTALQIKATGTGSKQVVTLYKGGKYILRESDIGSKIGSFPFDRAGGTDLHDGITAFAGPRADPFFFDLFQFFSILPDRYYANPRTGDALGTATPSFNGYASGSTSGTGGYACSTAPSTNALTQINHGFDVVSIVLEVPRSLLGTPKSPLIHLWATTSVPHHLSNGFKTGSFDQIELLSRPAVKELFETFANHAVSNVSEPYQDPTLQNSISYFMQNVAGRSKPISAVATAVLYPNEIAADLSQSGPAAYLGVETGGATGGKFGGRGLTDDVIDTSLGAVFGAVIPSLGLAPDDKKENNCLTNEHVASGQGGVQTKSSYPYLAMPH